MKRIFCRTAVAFSLLLSASFPSGVFSAQEEHQHHSVQPAPANPLVEEMHALDRAYRDIVSAVALGNTEKIHEAIESLHGTMEKTHEGIRAGTVTLPKNASLTKEFSSQDHKFHDQLEALDRATRHNNQREMLRITKQLLDGCVKCHQTFRD